jgi:hypothetical protein
MTNEPKPKTQPEKLAAILDATNSEGMSAEQLAATIVEALVSSGANVAQPAAAAADLQQIITSNKT